MKKLNRLLLMFSEMSSASVIPLNSTYADKAAEVARKLQNPRANIKVLKTSKRGDSQ